MRTLKVKAMTIGVAASAIVLVVGFQNCSETQFKAVGGDSLSSLTNQNIDSSTQFGSAQETTGGSTQASSGGTTVQVVTKIDTVTPRIVLSDSLNGDPKVSFSPKRIIYGTVYGIGKDNVHVCMAANYGCDYYPGYFQSGSTARHYSKPVGQLPNWRWQESDKTWRFTLDYKDVGDILDRIVLHYYIPDSQTDYVKFNYVNPEGIKLRLESYIYVSTPSASEAGIYFTSLGRDTMATQDITAYTGVKVMQDRGVGSTFTNIAGLGANVALCLEKTGTGRCAAAASWLPLQGQPSVAKYSTVRRVWQVTNSSAYVPSALGAVGGSYTVYAKDLDSGVSVNSQFFLNAPQVNCSWASSTAVVGPCSDPETSAKQCSQATVGQTLVGTGSCRASYTCKCN